jgi:hypothetical protein
LRLLFFITLLLGKHAARMSLKQSVRPAPCGRGRPEKKPSQRSIRDVRGLITAADEEDFLLHSKRLMFRRVKDARAADSVVNNGSLFRDVTLIF